MLAKVTKNIVNVEKIHGNITGIDQGRKVEPVPSIYCCVVGDDDNTRDTRSNGLEGASMASNATGKISNFWCVFANSFADAIFLSHD